MFDWTDPMREFKTRMYHKITAPTHPLLVADALHALNGLKVIKLNEVSFQGISSIDVSRYLDCEFDIH